MLELADNTAVNGETINLHSGIMCYKITPKDAFKSMQGHLRTIKVEFGSHLKSEDLPSRVTFFLTSEANSYGVESSFFADGEPYVSEISLNRQEVLTLKPVKRQYLKEMRDGCSDKTAWEMTTEVYTQKVKEKF